MTDRDAYLILNLLPGIGPVRVTQLLTLFGGPAALLAAKHSAVARVPGIGARIATRIGTWKEHCQPARERDLAERGGVEIITRDDESYPPELREIHDPPLCLYVRGDLEALRRSAHGIAIVGSRRTTRYGVEVAANLAGAAALAGWTVVSGLARGIDTAAHEAALCSEGRTVAVLGSGLGRIYPQENVELARRIAAEGGAVISELPMLYRPDKRTFPMRNRIISGMTRGCIVVQAGQRSGALITANQALEQNRQVFAVPGPVDSPQSRGCHALLRDGATLVETFHDVLEEFACLPGLASTPTASAAEAAHTAGAAVSRDMGLQLTPFERKLLDFVADDVTRVDDIVAGLEAPPSQVLGALVALEMRHLVRQLPGKRVSCAVRNHVG